jgi:hypothetical protein
LDLSVSTAKWLDGEPLKEIPMSRKISHLLILSLFLLSAANWFYARKAKAAPQASFGQAACRSYVPEEWGEYKGNSEHYGIVFQDSSGTLRFVTNVPCEATPQIALEIRRGSPPN